MLIKKVIIKLSFFTSNQWTCDGYQPIVNGSVATNLHYILWRANGLGGNVQLIWGREKKKVLFVDLLFKAHILNFLSF
jgi:hypothetical protein